MKSIRYVVGAALAGSALLTLGATGVRAETTVEELDQKVRILERKLEIADEAAAAKAKETPVVSAGKDGFALTSADKTFQLKLRGYAQADARFFQDDTDKKVIDTFTLRRARVIFDGTVGKSFVFRIAPDFGGGTSQLQDGYLDYKGSDLLNLRFGRTKVPFGLERLQSSTDTLLSETALTTALTPSYDEGVLWYGSMGTGVVDLALGVFNGGPDGASVDSDSDDNKDVAARVWLSPFKNTEVGALSGLSFGIAGTFGKQTGATNAPGLSSYKSSGQQTFFSYKSSSNAADTAVADGDRTRLSPQLYYVIGSLGVLGEYVISEQDVANGKGSDTIKNEAWQIAASYVLTGESPSLKGVNPAAPFDLAKGQWGAFELVGRVSELDIDDTAFTGKYADAKKSATAAQNWGAGVNWYLTKNAKFSVDYETTTFDGGAATGDRADEKLVIARAQIAF